MEKLGRGSPVTALRYAPKGDLLAVGHRDCCIELLDVRGDYTVRIRLLKTSSTEYSCSFGLLDRQVKDALLWVVR